MYSIGNYLIDRLYEVGLRRIYGVPGDYNLNFIQLLVDDGRIEWIGCCNELNAAYAADGDARISGFAVVLTTQCVGDLSALQPIAGSFCENVPVLSISGVPPLNAAKNHFPLHHTLLNGDYQNNLEAYRPFTREQARLTPEGHPAKAIDSVIETVFREKKPAYLQLPSDVTPVQIPAPQGTLSLSFSPSDPQTLRTITEFLTKKLQQAKSPYVILDGLAGTYGLEQAVFSFCETLNIPYCLMINAKTLLSRKHPLYAGQYSGKSSIPATLSQDISNSDCVIGIGVSFSDVSSGFFTNDISADSWVNLGPYGASAGFDVPKKALGKTLTGAKLEDILNNLKATLKPFEKKNFNSAGSGQIAVSQEWSYSNFLTQFENFLSEKDLVFADTGSASVAANRMAMPGGLKYQAQNDWAAIGWATPAMLGAALAQKGLKEDRRLILLTGDGALQLTVQAISTMARHKLPIIIFIINNKGYSTERVIEGKNAIYNDVADWDYSKILSVFDPSGNSASYSVRSNDELMQAFNNVKSGDKLSVIELHFDPLDIPQSLWNLGKAVDVSDYGRSL